MAQFSPKSVSRIDRAVIAVERRMRNRGPLRGRWHGQSEGFRLAWARAQDDWLESRVAAKTFAALLTERYSDTSGKFWADGSNFEIGENVDFFWNSSTAADGVVTAVNDTGDVTAEGFTGDALPAALSWGTLEHRIKYPNGQPCVSCKTCDRSGLNVRGAEFWVELPRRVPPIGGWAVGTHHADPSVYAGNVIAWAWDVEGDRICLSEYLNMGKIKDIRIQAVTDQIYEGWHDCDGTPTSTLPGTHNAGDFNLIDTAGEQYPIGVSYGKVGAMLRHFTDDHPIGTRNLSTDLLIYDFFGNAAESIALPNYGDWQDDNGDEHSTGRGEYPVVSVRFLQRYM